MSSLSSDALSHCGAHWHARTEFDVESSPFWHYDTHTARHSGIMISYTHAHTPTTDLSHTSQHTLDIGAHFAHTPLHTIHQWL